VKPLEISSTADAFASDSDKVHLVTDEFGQAEELGVRQCDLPKSEEIECPDDFESSMFRPLLHRVPAVEWILILTTVKSDKGIYDILCRVAPWL
jgi:hypothetical protein